MTEASTPAEPIDTESQARVRVLGELRLLDTELEPEFDDLVEIAAAICEVPIGLISLLDEKRQWIRSCIGMTVRETPIEESFCLHTLRAGELMVVEDATLDERFRSNPFVTADGGIRFYAGVPVSCAGGPPLGTLCVVDGKPRKMNTLQISALRVLARQVDARLELRAKRHRMAEALAEAQEMKRKLAFSEAMFRSFMNNGPFHAFVKSAYGSFLYYNQPLAEYFGLSESELVGKRDADLGRKENAPRDRRQDLEVLRSGKLNIQEESVLDRQGQKRCWRTYKFPCVSVDGLITIGAISQDITDEVEQTLALESSRRELQDANRRLQFLAQTDALTTLPNRRSFDERLAFEWSVACRQHQKLSAALLDIDHFKHRNDTFGHAAGDLVLQQLAGLLRSGLREKDMFARYGGEEFALLLPNTDEGEARLIAERLLALLRQAPWDHEPVTASFGVASLDCARKGSPFDAEELLRFADMALYAAKHAGRDRAMSYSECLPEETLERGVGEVQEVSTCVV